MNDSDTTAYHKQVILPSRGLFYGDKVPDGIVYVEPMGTQQEKIFAAGRQGSVAINKVFDDCITSPIPHLDLVLGDRLWLLMNIRAISRGSKYEFSFSCDNCRSQGVMSLDLLELKLQEPPADFDPVSDYPFLVQLPILGNEIGIRLLTGRDDEAVDRYYMQLKRHNQKAADEAKYIYRFARRVATIDGEKPGIQEAMKFVERIRGLDLQAVQDCIDENEVGPNIEIQPECESCGFINDPEALPVRREFFRPTKRRSPFDGDYIGAAVALDE